MVKQVVRVFSPNYSAMPDGNDLQYFTVVQDGQASVFDTGSVWLWAWVSVLMPA
jgi:hypothetical protein